MVVELGEPQVFQREMLQALDRFARLELPTLDGLEEFEDLLRGHGAPV
jgi:hypothetical protein